MHYNRRNFQREETDIMETRRAARIRLLFYTAICLYTILVFYSVLRSPAPLVYSLARAAGLLGYGALFMAILSHEYMRDMRRLFGKPFMTVHHVLAVAGLALSILHPVLLFVLTRDLTQFVPRFDSLRTLLLLGGRPALYLILIAFLAAVLRGRLKSTWRVIHWLNYLAFVLVFTHSWLLGRHASQGIFRLLWPAMLVSVVLVFARKRIFPER